MLLDAGIFSEISYGIVVYAFLTLYILPIFAFKPLLLIGLLLIQILFPVFFEFKIKLGPVNVYFEDIVLALYCFLASYVILKRLIAKENLFDVPEEGRIIVALVLLYITLHVFYMFSGLYQGVSPQNIIRRFSQYSGCLYFFFPLLFVHNRSQLHKLLIFIIIMSGFYTLWQLYIAMTHQVTFTSSGTVRVTSEGIPLIACALFALLVYGDKVFHFLLAVFPMISIILTGHRSMFLALAMSLLFYLQWTKKITKLMLFVYIGGFGLLSGSIVFEMLTGHDFARDAITRAADTFNSENKTSIGRANKIKDNIFVFTKNPILGIGYNYEKITNVFGYPGSRKPSDFEYASKEYNVLHPHNFVLRIISHFGIVGGSLSFVIIFLILKRCFSISRMNGTLGKHGAFLFCSIVFFLVTALMNTTFTAEGAIFWILSGASVLIYKTEYSRDKVIRHSGQLAFDDGF